MRKYFTRRCVGLHVVAIVVVPLCLLAGWWQYHVALAGNDWGWVYTVEWPFFAAYGLYVWWRLIHDESTPFDRLWAAKQRAAADASGRPLHEIPGWAMDKELSRAVTEASAGARDAPALPPGRAGALDRDRSVVAPPLPMAAAGPCSEETPEREPLALPSLSERGEAFLPDRTGAVIDARVLEDEVVVDEELNAYNRYLAELSWSGPSKRWGARPGRRNDAGGAGPHQEHPREATAPDR
jgi:hypothetical protein